MLKEILPELSFPEAPPPHKTQACQRPAEANTKRDGSPAPTMSKAAVIQPPDPTFSSQNVTLSSHPGTPVETTNTKPNGCPASG